MNAHDRYLEIAAAAIDFAPTLQERASLDEHLAGCSACRREVRGLHEDARAIAALPPRRVPADVSVAVRASLDRRPASFRPALALAMAALLVLLSIAVAAVGAEVIRRLDHQRLVIVEPSLPTVPTVAPSMPVPSNAAAGWSLAELPAAPAPPFALRAVSRSTLGWIAIGDRRCVTAANGTSSCQAQLALSADGRTWESVGSTFPLASGWTPPNAGPEPGLTGVAAGPDGYVVVGFVADGANLRPSAWWSTDGRTWERIAFDPTGLARPAAVLRTPDRWLIGGQLYGDLAGGTLATATRPLAAVWGSTDGRTWTRVDDPATFAVGGYVDTMEDPMAGGISGFASDGTRIVAAGMTCADTGRPCTPMAWTSEDGLAWARSPMPAVDAWTSGIVHLPGAFLVSATCTGAAGAEGTPCLYRSPDGIAWRAVDPGVSGTTAVVAMAGSGASGLVVLAGSSPAFPVGTAVILVSSDGAAWSTVGTVANPADSNPAGVTAVPLADGTFRVVTGSATYEIATRG